MAQLSRPYQIALVAALAALALFAAVWFVALRHSAAESSSPASSPSAPAAAGSSSSSAGSSAAAGKVYHGSAPGVEGLTRDIAKAHGAVAESQRNAQQLQSKSAQTSGEGSAAASSAAAPAAATRSAASASAATHAATHAATRAATRTASSKHGSSGAGAHVNGAPRAAALESELDRGKVAVVLFWNPRASDDRQVHEQLDALSHGDRQIAVQVARSTEVTAFGQLTRTVQVTGTPTVLIVNHRRQATMVTGLTDDFSLQQAIGDAKEGVGRVLAPRFSSWTPTSHRAKFIDEANRMCRQAAGATVRQLESLGTTKARATAYVSALVAVFHKIEGLHVPPGDRAFIHRQLSDVQAVIRLEKHGPLNALGMRKLFLEGEAAGDRLHNALTAYGLSSCV